MSIRMCAWAAGFAGVAALTPALRAQYCVAGSDSCSADNNDERITRVVFNSLDNNSGPGDGPAGCYSDFTALSTTVFRGQSYTITVSNAFGYPPDDQCVAWFDWNQDGTLGNAASGEQFALTGDAAQTTFTGTVTVPATAVLGPTRMRVRVMYTGAPSPCGNTAYGEVEDYTVLVQQASSPLGACCTGAGACAQNTQSACTGAGSFYMGQNVACAPTPCPTGACCSGAACAQVIANACTGGPTFFAGGSCTPAYPPPAQRSDAVENIALSGPSPGTPLNPGGGLDDGVQSGVPIGFTFNYYGAPQTTLSVCTNGFAYFGAGTFTDYNPSPIPSTSTPNSLLAPFWVDLLLTDAGQITYATRGTAPYRRFIVEWAAVGRYDNATGAPTGSNTFEIILYETADAIAYRYGSMDRGVATAVPGVGLENSDGTVGTAVNQALAGAGNTSFVFQFATSPCSGPQPPTGACCAGGASPTCSAITYGACLAAGGGFQGNGTTCASAPCVFGACCALAGGCAQAVQSVCAANGGVYQGDQAACGVTPCPARGSCCSGTACALALQPNCQGVFTSNGSCVPNLCAGACCNTASGACTLTTPSGCAAPGVFQTAGSTCNPNPCSGSCCNPSTGGCTVTGSAGCAAPSVFQIAGACAPNPCTQPPPPANDDCAGALALTLGTPRTGTISNATGSAVSGGCTGTNIDVWYTFTPAASGSFTVMTTPAAPGDAATSIIIAPACPIASNANYIACTAQPGPGVTNTLSFIGAGGTLYYIRLGAYVGNTGAFSVVVNTLVSGACCNTTSGACTTSNAGSAGCAAGTVYQGDNSACGSNPCGQGACCNPTTGVCALSTMSGCVPLNTFPGAGSACSPNPCAQPPPPVNDDCTAALPITVGTPINADTFSATPSSTLTTTGTGSCTQASFNTGLHRDVFYRLTAPATAAYTIDTCGSTMPDTVLSLNSACPVTQANLLDCNDDAIGVACPTSGVNSRITSVTLAAGQIVYIGVAGYNGATGYFVLTVTYVNQIGSCCNASSCTLTDQANCAAPQAWTGAGTCSPNPCTPTGVCCRGATCNAGVTQANCTPPTAHAGAAFVSTATACNAPGNFATPCCEANYNRSGGVSVQDIFDFLADWFAGSPFARVGGDGSGTAPGVQSIFDFLGGWFAGGCT